MINRHLFYWKRWFSILSHVVWTGVYFQSYWIHFRDQNFQSRLVSMFVISKVGTLSYLYQMTSGCVPFTQTIWLLQLVSDRRCVEMRIFQILKVAHFYWHSVKNAGLCIEPVSSKAFVWSQRSRCTVFQAQASVIALFFIERRDCHINGPHISDS